MPALSKHTPKDNDLIEGTWKLGEATYAGSGYARTHFAEIIDRSKNSGEKTLITEHNKPAAAIVTVQDFRIVKLIEALGLAKDVGELTYQDFDKEDVLNRLGELLAMHGAGEGDVKGSEQANVQSNNSSQRK